MPKQAILIILLLLSPPAGAQSNSADLPIGATRNRVIPPDFFGMHAFFASNSPPRVSIGSLGKTTCTGWAYIETARGLYHWASLDSARDKAAALGVDAFVSAYAIPAWAVSDRSKCVVSECGSEECDGTLPDSLTDVDNFWTVFATRYCGSSIKYLELANEPYLEWSPSDLANLTTHIYHAVRAACPSMKIVTPSMAIGSDGFASSYFSAGGPTGVDIASIHAYQNYVSPVAAPEQIVAGGRLFPTALVSVINEYLPGKPIWDTEGSWGPNSAVIYDADQKAADVSRYFIMHWSAGFSRLYWYAWDESNWGTLNPNETGSSVPAAAYQQTYNWLVGRVMSPPCSVGPDKVTWTCGLTGMDGYVGLIVWDTAGDRNYTPPNDGGYTKYRDLAGNLTTYSSGPVKVGVEPILFER